MCVCPSVSSKPVVGHAVSVPGHRTDPAPLTRTQYPRTYHVHTTSVLLHWDATLRTWFRGLSDGVSRRQFPPAPLEGALVHHETLLCSSAPRAGRGHMTQPIVERFLTVPTEDETTAQAVAPLTLHSPGRRGLRDKPRPTAHPGAQDPAHLKQALLRPVSMVTLILLIPKDSEMMQLLHERVWTPSCARQ